MLESYYVAASVIIMNVVRIQLVCGQVNSMVFLQNPTYLNERNSYMVEIGHT